MADAGRHPQRKHWFRRHLPTRESIHRSRLLRPLAPHLTHRSLWQLNRRSVPRGVALGLFVGILIPVMHTALAAILAIPTRANLVLAAAFTLVVNPLTIPPLYYAAYRIGSWELHQDVPLVSPADAERFTSELARLLFWLHQASGPIAMGVLSIAAAAAALGYLGASIFWTTWLKRRLRRQRAGRTQYL